MIERMISNADLSTLNTLAVPSYAEFFCRCASIDELHSSLHWAREKQCNIRILGGGSNVLLDEHIDGLVLQPEFAGIEVTSETAEAVSLSVGAGENWHNFVTWATSKHYNGIENLALIPGSVGAAPIQNIGAYGVEVSRFIHQVDCVNLLTGELVTFSKHDCEFSYRHSFFKSEKGRHFLITRVHFQLNKRFDANISYPALSAAFEGGVPASAADVAKEVERIRRSRLPDPDTLPNAGSFFKNPVVTQSVYAKLEKQFPGIVAFDVAQNLANDSAIDNKGGSKKLAAAWLIDQRGWKSKIVNGVSVHATQALVITNPNRTSIASIMKLASDIQHDIQTYYGVELEVEPQSLHRIKI